MSLHGGAAINEILQVGQWIDELEHLAAMRIIARQSQVEISDLTQIQLKLSWKLNKVLGARKFHRLKPASERTDQGRNFNSWMGQH